MKTKVKGLVACVALMAVGACGAATEQELQSFDASEAKMLLQPIGDEPASLCGKFDLATRHGARSCLQAMVAQGMFQIPGVTQVQAIEGLVKMGVSPEIASVVVGNNLEMLGIAEADRSAMEFAEGCRSLGGAFAPIGVNASGDVFHATCNFSIGGSSCVGHWSAQFGEALVCN